MSLRCPSFRYIGGKVKLAPVLVEHMPRSGRTFVDVFGGRANILLRAIHEELEFEKWVLNDIKMAPFYRAIRDHEDKFKATARTPEEFHRLKELAKQNDVHSLLMCPWITWGGSTYEAAGITTAGGVRTAARYEANVRLACRYLREKQVKITQLVS